MNLTDKFIDELYCLSKKQIEKVEIHCFKGFLIDYLGVTLAGASMLGKKSDKMLSILKSKGDATAIGVKKKISLQSAILLNGLSSHVAELDDGIIESSVHPGAPLLSALLPIAEIEDVSFENFLRGVLVGYEAISRLANTIQPSHKLKGYHASSTCGAIGTSVGISAMLNLSKQEMKDTFSAAVVSASGSLKAIEDDSQLKPLNIANASLNAYISSVMGRSGFKGPIDVLSGKRGFLNLMSNEYDTDKLFSEKLEFEAIHKVYVKPYAACRYCHPAIDAALFLRDQIKDVKNIKNVQVKTYELAVFNHDHVYIDNISSAKMSIPYSVSVSMVKGSADIEVFSNENIFDDTIVELTKKISVTSSEEYTKNFPRKSQALLEVTTYDGAEFSKKIDYPLGEPENSLSYDQVISKFSSLAKYSGKSEIEISDILKNLDEIENNFIDLLKIL
jgi:2-methylcitrate dehydratase PrpD